MSMVMELVEKLRWEASHTIGLPDTEKLLEIAADTIEELSAKVAKQNVINKSPCDSTDYICRQDLINYIYDMDNNINLFRWRNADKIKNGLKYIIERQPAVDAEPIRSGKWVPEVGIRPITKKVDKTGRVLCSKCGFATSAYNFNYCPGCGAKMEEESENERETF